MHKLIVTAAILIASTSAGLAEEMSGHQMGGAAPALPAICLKEAGTGDPMAMPMGGTGDAAHTALMAGMDQMNADMMAGATATDIDVAFVCSMIPHHRGAIAMAAAELQYGDDAWAKQLAQQIIAAQEQEIADMLAWLAKQPE